MPLRFRKGRLILACCALAGGSPSTLHAKSARLYAGNSVADNISVIDLNSLIGDIHVGPHVHGMAVQAAGSRLFTTSEGDKAISVQVKCSG